MLEEQKWTMQLTKTTTFRRAGKSKQFGSEEFTHLILNCLWSRLNATWQGEPMHSLETQHFCFGAKKVLECWEIAGVHYCIAQPNGQFWIEKEQSPSTLY